MKLIRFIGALLNSAQDDIEVAFLMHSDDMETATPLELGQVFRRDGRLYVALRNLDAEASD